MPFMGGGGPLILVYIHTHTHDRLDELRSALAEAQLKRRDTYSKHITLFPPMSQFPHRPALVPRLTRPSTAAKLTKLIVYKESLLHRLLN